MSNNKFYVFALLMFIYKANAEVPDEVKYLISEVESSGCTFIRNGTEHSSKKAAEHLTLKYKNATKYAKTGRDFINNLASKSSWTGKKYKISCPGKDVVDAKVWLSKKLNDYSVSHQSR